MIPVITVDGPSGSGKGTICHLLASKLAFNLLDSGALYRLCALALHQLGDDAENPERAGEVAQQMDIQFKLVAGKTQTILKGDDVGQAIRQEHIGLLASKVAAYPQVRDALLQRQRDFCRPPGLVADGRDMGTVVFPDATAKIFLTASAEARAERRVLQLGGAGNGRHYQTILDDIKQRDARDANRQHAPMVAAADALQIDSTTSSVDDVFHKVYQHVLTCIEKVKE